VVARTAQRIAEALQEPLPILKRNCKGTLHEPSKPSHAIQAMIG
jgi:hypothetical protein